MTDPARSSTEPERPRVAISTSGGSIAVLDRELFGTRLGDLGLEFARRVFALPEVTALEIDAEQGKATVFQSGSGRIEFLERLASAIRGNPPAGSRSIRTGSIGLELATPIRKIAIQVGAGVLTTWRVIHEQPGRVRLRHPELRGDIGELARLRARLLRLPGVSDARTSTASGGVLVEYDSAETGLSRILAELDPWRRRAFQDSQQVRHPKPPSFGLANASVVLAAVSQTVAPAVAPACALLLVGANVETVRTAARQLRAGRVGLPALYTGIVTATLVSGQYLASAAMSWMLVFWRRAYQQTLDHARTSLLGEIVEPPLHTRLAVPTGAEVQTRIADLKPGDLVAVAEGETIPADGRIVEGGGLVDERMPTGSEGLSRKLPSDPVFSGSTFRSGEALVEIVRDETSSRSAVLARAVLGSANPRAGAHAASAAGEAFADKTVAPTLAMAGVGLLLGDVTTAAAILRPDYATGVGFAHPLETLQAVALCARHGVLVREAAAIERLPQTDLLILDHHLAIENRALEVSSVVTFDSHTEKNILALAAAAFQPLGERRARALWQACRLRSVSPPRVSPIAYTPDIAFKLEDHVIKIGGRGDVPGRDRPSGSESRDAESLMVGIDGRIAGLVHFAPAPRLEAAAAIARLKAKRGISVGLLSSQPSDELAPLAAALDVDFHLGGCSLDDRVGFLRMCQNRGRKAAYVGDCRLNPRVLEHAAVAFSIVGEDEIDLDNDPASIWLLGRGVLGLPEIWDIAWIHKRRVASARGRAILPNLVCVAGAFAWGFTSLASVILTNLGTYSIHAQTRSSIRALERQINRSLRQRPFPARWAGPEDIALVTPTAAIASEASS